jgi:WD40 repeat protein
LFVPSSSILKGMLGRTALVDCVKRSPKPLEYWNDALPTLESHSASVTSVSFSPDGKMLVSTSEDLTSKLWDSETGKLLHTFGGQLSSHAASTQFSPNGKKLATWSLESSFGRGVEVNLWDVESGALLRKFMKSARSRFRAVQFSLNSEKLFVAADDFCVQSGSFAIGLWDAWCDVLLHVLENHSGSVTRLSFSPDAMNLASASEDKTVKLWDVESGKLLQTAQEHLGFVHSMQFSPNGVKLAFASTESRQPLFVRPCWNRIHIWDTRNARYTINHYFHSKPTTTLEFSPNGKQLASSSSETTFRLWNTERRFPPRIFHKHSESVQAVKFFRNGLKLASASRDKTVCVWAVDGKQEDALLQSLAGHLGPVNDLQFSPDGRKLASASSDMTARVWDTKKTAPCHMHWAHTGAVNAVRFSPDGDRLCASWPY